MGIFDNAIETGEWLKECPWAGERGGEGIWCPSRMVGFRQGQGEFYHIKKENWKRGYRGKQVDWCACRGQPADSLFWWLDFSQWKKKQGRYLRMKMVEEVGEVWGERFLKLSKRIVWEREWVREMDVDTRRPWGHSGAVTPSCGLLHSLFKKEVDVSVHSFSKYRESAFQEQKKSTVG